MKTIQLSSGTTMPEIGFGLWQIRDRQACINSVQAALQAGYRHFDCAQVYGNESFLGEALAASAVPRAELFITTKIHRDNQHPDNLMSSVTESLKNLQTDYIDLLLLHFPFKTRHTAWVQLEEIYASGRVKAIGVSNYTIEHLQELLETCKVLPAVNQVELHVFLQQPELVRFCQDHNIVVEAYSPLAHGRGLGNAILAEIAHKYGKNAAQVMIRWCLQVGAVPLPKSATPERIESNLDVYDFELSDEDMAKLAALDDNMRTGADPLRAV